MNAKNILKNIKRLGKATKAQIKDSFNFTVLEDGLHYMEVMPGHFIWLRCSVSAIQDRMKTEKVYTGPLMRDPQTEDEVEALENFYKELGVPDDFSIRF